ncbi:MAG: von Willebrand factor type A domain-containing protein, partial [Nitrospinota bacterium]
MDEKKIRDILRGAKLPRPEQSAKDRAILSALEEFKKNKRKTQGVSITERLIDKLTHLRRRSMEKRFALTGALGVTASIMITIWATSVPFKKPYLTDLSPPKREAREPVLREEKQPLETTKTLSQNQVFGKQDKGGGQKGPALKEDLKPQSSPDEEKNLSRSPAPREIKTEEGTLGKNAPGFEIQLSAPPVSVTREREDAPEPRRLAKSQSRPLVEKDASQKPSFYTSKNAESLQQTPGPTSRDFGGRAGAPAGQLKEEKPGLQSQSLPVSEVRRKSGGEPGPLAGQEPTGRDRFAPLKVNNVHVVSEEPVSTFSIDVDTASYSFVRREINHGRLPQKDAVRVEEMINYFPYKYALPEDAREPFRPTIALWQTPWNPDTRLLHIGIKGHEIPLSEKPRSNLVFLLDVSGSMNSQDKLPLLKNSFRMLVETLGPNDLVSIVVYAGAAGTVLEPTSVSEKGKILEALDRLHAGGATAGGEGIRRAYALAEANFDKEGINRVILATDGDFNVGIRNTSELKGFVERKRETGVFLSVLGFGQGNYNDALMQALAQNGNGNAAYIDSLSEARKVLVEEASSTLFTIAKDVKIQVEFNPKRVSEYRLIGYETRKLNREDFNNDKVDAGEVGAGHSVTALYEVTLASEGAGLVDKLRYAVSEKEGVTKSNEYAFLKIRYKAPGSKVSKLITRPITDRDRFLRSEEVSKELRFASIVAAFGQKLRGGAHLRNFS